MPDNWRIVATAHSASHAVALRTLLESAGMAVTLAEPAEDHIFIQVSEADFERAQSLLKNEPVPLPMVDVLKRSRPDDDEGEADDRPDGRGQLTRKAFMATLFGLAFPVILPFGFVLFIQSLFTPGKLAGRYRAFAFATGFIYLAPVLAVAWLIVVGPGALDPDADMKHGPNPDALVGVWQRIEEKGGERLEHVMDLNEDGTMRYQIFSRDPFGYRGYWVYDNHGLYLRFRTPIAGDEPWEGRTLYWPMRRCDGREAVFSEGRDEVVYRRR